MRDLLTLSRFAVLQEGCPPNCSLGGSLEMSSPATGAVLRIIATAMMGWDHVSVSTRKRCPNWPEMARVEDLFLWPHACAMQLHVPVEHHVDVHPYCLHLWRSHDPVIPRPPAVMVGQVGMTHAEARDMTPAQRMAQRLDTLAVLEREQAGLGALRIFGTVMVRMDVSIAGDILLYGLHSDQVVDRLICSEDEARAVASIVGLPERPLPAASGGPAAP